MLGKLFNRLTKVESIQSLLQQWWGVWQVIAGIAFGSGGVAMTALAWLAGMPAWGLILLGMVAGVLVLAAMYFVAGVQMKRREKAFFESLAPVGRGELANEAQELSSKISSLIAEFTWPLTEARMVEDEGYPWKERRRIESKLVERYNDRYATDAQLIFRRASKLILISHNFSFAAAHGVQSERDVHNVQVFLAHLADDLRSPIHAEPFTKVILRDYVEPKGKQA